MILKKDAKIGSCRFFVGSGSYLPWSRTKLEPDSYYDIWYLVLVGSENIDEGVLSISGGLAA